MAVGYSFRAAAAAGAIVLTLGGCEPAQTNAQQKQAPPPPKVTVAKPVKQMVRERDEYVGRFVAIDYVEVRARVSGYLDSISFKDGEQVTKGAPLFTIDKRPFQSAVDQSRANLAQARANLAFADSELQRTESLPRGTVITQQTYEQRVQAKKVAEAAVALQEAAVRQAQLDLSFTDLAAPVSGKIGDRRVSVGNLVTGGTSGNTTLLATIVSTDPIRFEFTVDEASYLRYMRVISPNGNGQGHKPVPVRLKLIDETAFAHEGALDFVDNVIDRTSGTMRLRAEVPNPKGLFAPGMFARIEIAPAPPAEALLVPDAAIGSEQARKFVLVVDEKNVARQRYVTLGDVVDGNRVIKSGLAAADSVIVNGLMRARPGTTVTPQEASAAAEPQPKSN